MRVPYYDDATLQAIIKQGEERAKYGQTNRRITAVPERKPRFYKVRRNTKAIDEEVSWAVRQRNLAIIELLAALELAKFHAMGDVVEWRRLDSIKQLAIQQLKDESGKWIYQVARIGRQEIEFFAELPEAEPLWKQETKTQLALGAGMASYLARLTDTQEQTLRLRFWSRLTQEETANYMHISKNSVKVNEARAKNALWRHFVMDYGDEL